MSGLLGTSPRAHCEAPTKPQGLDVRHEGARESEGSPCSMLYKRWGLAPRSRRAGGGFKPPTAAAFKRRGGERVGNRQGRSLSGEGRGVERE